ncbi:MULTISPECIES: hypothetical protein [Ramlibacter]|uniref:Uncharacterized protein n=1 Tax=Ramlibacter aquaticus TaxID=2780094 RepID=A0ABR9SHR4_9BURK|nr:MULTISPECIES: hypothetical protein [Ramlibacter]MBE7941714.1 hypothetical protein [Ramlibacter aquaticus]
MRSLLTAAALCAALQGAFAQGTCAPAAQAGPVAVASASRAAAPAGRVAAPAPAPAPVHGELIKTAAAGTRDGMPAASVPRPHENRPQRGGVAMLLAALALMSGIALRRYGGTRA